MTGRGRNTRGKKATNNNRLRVMPPGSLAIANNRMCQQKKPSAAQRAVTAIKKVPSTVQKVQEPPSQAATPVQEPPSQAATLVQAPPSQAAAPINTPPPTTTSEAFRFIPIPGFTLSRQFQQGPPQHITHDMERDHHHHEDEQEHEEGNQEVDEEGEIEKDGEEDNHDKDISGKVVIRPVCNGRVIEKTFPNNITCYSEVKNEARKLWFERFGKIVSWEPHHEHVIKANFHRNCGKRLTDIFTKLRKKDAHHIRVENQKIEAARVEAARARTDAEAAKADAAAARAEAAAANANYKSLETKFEEFQTRMMALESGSCSGHSRQSSHPHYDNELDDQSVDEDEDDQL
ncbi:hypothetical protein QL285_038855 [Trifolium repens]|nr:hypothetical protein QL285_038855 [Trifolium repens]